MAITHEEFGHGTGTLEAARAFKDEIVGKVGELAVLFWIVDRVAVCFYLLLLGACGVMRDCGVLRGL